MARSLPLAAALLGAASALSMAGAREAASGAVQQARRLPAVREDASYPLAKALARRRSVRSYATRDLTIEEIAGLVWAAQGTTEPSTGGRAAPSAGALYPIEVYVVAREGVSRYVSGSHALEDVIGGDRRGALARAALGQDAVRDAAADIVLAGVPSRLARKYGDRAERYVLLEAGHVAQNVLLEAVALGLGAVPIGAFDDEEVARIVGLRAGERPLYVLAVGAPAK